MAQAPGRSRPGLAPAFQTPAPGVAYPEVLDVEPDVPITTRIVRSLAGVLVGIVSYWMFTPLLIAAVLTIGWALAGQPGTLDAYYQAGRAFEFPAGMVAAHLGIAVFIPISLALVMLLHHVHPRWLASVQPGFRWRYWLASLLVAVVVLGAMLAFSWSQTGWAWQPQEGFGWFLLAIVLTSPIQAAAEEVFFRGYLLQALQLGTRVPWFGVVGSALLFALFHGTQNLPLFVDRFGFGLLAGFLVVKTGGLEAGIAAHVVNNLLAFSFAGLTSTIAQVRATNVIGWTDLARDLIGFAVFAAVAIWVGRRMGLATTTPGPTAVVKA